jgi:pilus assembly protein Flp/PilA
VETEQTAEQNIKRGMATMRSFLNNLWRDDSGQDLAEYALLFALIAIVAVASLIVIGGGISDIFTGVGNELEQHMA